VLDARPIDAPPPIDARPIDATPIDAPCTPTWQNLLVNGNFDSATVPPWTQTSAIITASPPFAPRTAPNAARFGAGNNANDVLVQTVTVPATATGLRLRGYECHVTEDVITDADDLQGHARDARRRGARDVHRHHQLRRRADLRVAVLRPGPRPRPTPASRVVLQASRAAPTWRS
jgi:hypothetical protein